MTCQLRVLGCSGGISSDLRTTSLLINENILIDAGTGVGDLTLDELRKIDHVFLTHSHLDHICSVPFIADAVGNSRETPLKVYGIYQTIHALQEHVFNNVIWPDFTKIPSRNKPFISLHLLEIDESINLDGLVITPLPVDHSISANGYALKSDSGTMIFSGDTGVSDAFWNAVNSQSNIQHIVIETSFLDQEEDLAIVSGHLSPSLLMQELTKLNMKACHPELQIWICHLKPDGGNDIMQQITNQSKTLPYKICKLTRNTLLRF